jgi:hypothetical protein
MNGASDHVQVDNRQAGINYVDDWLATLREIEFDT